MHESKTGPIVFMFSGQGSQSYQMGRELFHENTVFRHWMQRAEDLVQQWLSVSILDEIYNDRREVAAPFTQTLLTHPAIFAVQFAMTQVLKDLGLQPDIVLGASLGEYSAAAVAEVFSFEDAMSLICLQAEILETHCPNSGGMLAVLAPLSLCDAHPWVRDTTTLAAVNTAEHFVLAGTAAKLRPVEQLLQTEGVPSQRLPVRHGFHSPAIDSLADIYLPVLERQALRDPVKPLVFCSEGGEIGAAGPAAFWNSIRAPIRFRQTLQTMEDRGRHSYLDLGPSGTLATFARRNLAPDSGSSLLSTLTPFGRDLQQLEKIKEALIPAV